MLNPSQALILHRFEPNTVYDAVFDANFTFKDMRDAFEENILRALQDFSNNER